MDKQITLAIISDDKPGIIKEVAQVLAKHNGNWLESQLSQMAGKFVGIVRASIPETDISHLNQSLLALAEFNIQIQLDEITTGTYSQENRSANFKATGPDRQGIVLEITQALTEYNINVETLTTNCTSMPYSGEPLFEVGGCLSLPGSTNLDQVIEQLDTIADTLGIDLELEEKTEHND